MRDEFEFATLVPAFDSVVLVPHLRRLLPDRNEMIRDAAQGDGWRRYLSEPNSSAEHSAGESEDSTPGQPGG
jgi:hypothetical protein